VHHVAVGGTHVEVEELGAGEPVVVVQTALTVDELDPLARALAEDFRVWHVRRPGYGALGPLVGPGSIEGDADLVAAVIEQQPGVGAHVVGASYSAAVVLSLAARRPDVVESVVLVEPPPYATPGAADFRAATSTMLLANRQEGTGRALDMIMGMIDGPDWRAHAERDLPGSVAAMERDAHTFFESDLPALLRWRLEDADAAGIHAPALLVGGSESSAWFGEMLTRLERVLAPTTRVAVIGAGHSVALTHPDEVAEAIRHHVRAVSPGTRAGGGAQDRS
jgi:pimeloyl-ACP methyl ester carboxylesterase